MGARSTRFGNFVVIAFLVSQACDGVLTYVGVSVYGTGAEGNPLMTWMMAAFGSGLAVATAKALASGFGIALHLINVHGVVAALAAFYLAVAVVPWLGILFF